MSSSVFKLDFQEYDPEPVLCAIGGQGSCSVFFQRRPGWAAVTDWNVQDPKALPALIANARLSAQARNAGHLRIITPANHPHVAAVRQLSDEQWETVSLGAPTASLQRRNDSDCPIRPRQIQEGELKARGHELAALVHRARDPKVKALEGKTVEDYTTQILDYPDRDAVWIAELGNDVVGFGMSTREPDSFGDNLGIGFYCDEKQRGKHLGRALWNCALDHFVGKGISWMQITTWKAPSVGFYKNAGLKCCGCWIMVDLPDSANVNATSS